MEFSSTSRHQLFPLNSQTAFSFKNGNPLINFSIARGGMLDPSSIRFNYSLKIQQATSQTQSPAQLLLPNNNDAKGTGTAINIKMNERVGSMAVVDVLTLSVLDGQSQNTTLESIRSSPRYLASVVPVSHSIEDMNSYMSVLTLNASRTEITSNMVNNVVGCSQQFLQSGLLNSQNLIPTHLFGMSVSLQLIPDAMLLSGADGNNTFYEITDCSLTFNMLNPTDDMAKMLAGQQNQQFTYNSVNTVYNTINSGNSFTNINWGLNNVKSVFSNFLPATSVNNYAVDSLATPELEVSASTPAIVDRVSFSRGGLLFPITEELDVKVSSTEDRCLVPVLKNGISAIIPFTRLGHSLVSPSTQIDINAQTNASSNSSILPLVNTTIGGVQPTSITNIGCSMDSFSEYGVSFASDTYGFSFKSNHTSAYPVGVFSFAVARNRLMVNAGRIMVSS